MFQSTIHFPSLLLGLILEEKFTLLSVRDFSTAAGVARLGIPPLRAADSTSRMKSAQVVRGSTINIHRNPRAGRNLQCFSKDRLISSILLSAIVNGRHHFYGVKEKVNGKPLRGIYLAAWQYILRNYVLLGDWNYKDIVMSGWSVVHDTVASIKVGLDLEMPF
ncbi:hypothetical protein PSV09DRAFT_2377195 [Bipolaris maydis]|nr:hypothetical protein J3E74DRAFT_432281 [Bipolaris maydis]KAJ6204086.1 hypothetical protein PSV09DRAFT_2377195 [Bipolaris maydis]